MPQAKVPVHVYVTSSNEMRSELHLKKLDVELAFWRDTALDQNQCIENAIAQLNEGKDVCLSVGGRRTKARKAR